MRQLQKQVQQPAEVLLPVVYNKELEFTILLAPMTISTMSATNKINLFSNSCCC